MTDRELAYHCYMMANIPVPLWAAHYEADCKPASKLLRHMARKVYEQIARSYGVR